MGRHGTGMAPALQSCNTLAHLYCACASVAFALAQTVATHSLQRYPTVGITSVMLPSPLKLFLLDFCILPFFFSI